MKTVISQYAAQKVNKPYSKFASCNSTTVRIHNTNEVSFARWH